MKPRQAFGVVDQETLFSAARAYVIAALEQLRKECSPERPRVLVGLRQWARDGGVFVQRDRVEPYWVQCIFTHLDQIHSLRERDVLLAALRADRNIGPQVGELFGTEFSRFTLTEDMVTDNLLWRVAERRDGLEFDETTFAEEFGAFVSDLQRTQYEIVVCAPVLGVTLGSPPISLSEELRPLRL